MFLGGFPGIFGVLGWFCLFGCCACLPLLHFVWGLPAGFGLRVGILVLFLIWMGFGFGFLAVRCFYTGFLVVVLGVLRGADLPSGCFWVFDFRDFVGIWAESHCILGCFCVSVSLLVWLCFGFTRVFRVCCFVLGLDVVVVMCLGW